MLLVRGSLTPFCHSGDHRVGHRNRRVLEQGERVDQVVEAFVGHRPAHRENEAVPGRCGQQPSGGSNWLPVGGGQPVRQVEQRAYGDRVLPGQVVAHVGRDSRNAGAARDRGVQPVAFPLDTGPVTGVVQERSGAGDIDQAAVGGRGEQGSQTVKRRVERDDEHRAAGCLGVVADDGGGRGARRFELGQAAEPDGAVGAVAEGDDLPPGVLDQRPHLGVPWSAVFAAARAEMDGQHEQPRSGQEHADQGFEEGAV